jgi:2'-5' RNA ligase
LVHRVVHASTAGWDVTTFEAMDSNGGRQRLFLAVRPPPRVVDALAHLVRAEQADRTGVRWTAPENLHLTLRFFGDAEADEIASVLEPVMPPPSALVVLGPAVTLLGRAVVVPAGGLDEAAALVRGATTGIGHHDPRPFVGHLTLGRLGKRSRCDLVGAGFEADFPLAAVELTASTPNATGPRYSVVRTWPVPPGPTPTGHR